MSNLSSGTHTAGTTTRGPGLIGPIAILHRSRPTLSDGNGWLTLVEADAETIEVNCEQVKFKFGIPVNAQHGETQLEHRRARNLSIVYFARYICISA